MATLRFENVYKDYYSDAKIKKRTGKTETYYAVNDLSLECRDGEFVGILGPSGCGKTTALRMVAGLEEITRGSIYISDRKVNGVLPRNRGIGLAFEDYALYPPLTVYDNIAFNLRAKKTPAGEIDAEVKRIASLLKVDNLLDKRPVQLSGGQKQRVNIARAIIRRPQVLLLDEPLSHLDGKMRQALRTEIKRLHHEIRCTTIIVTHDQLEAMSLADRIAVMKDGLLQQFGTAKDVYDDPENEFVAGFIGDPPMNLADVEVVSREDKLMFAFVRGDFKLPVPKSYEPVLHRGERVRLGIRPTELIAEPENGSGEPAIVDVYEDLGDECRISVAQGDGYLSVILEDDRRYRSGEKIKLRAKEEKVLLFSHENGSRIRAAK
ncbi:MAG: ABC transporter ATP-binding protein [Synergistaceae bacterium]|jgi:multiple sugar transport system ATP-binding protein|nr:ABC transporter ATP-binding protein [Synergistaceae bacterium]